MVVAQKIWLSKRDLVGRFTIMRFGHTELIKNSVGLPPPMVFGLGKLCLSIMPIEVRPIGIETFQPLSSKKERHES